MEYLSITALALQTDPLTSLAVSGLLTKATFVCVCGGGRWRSDWI